MKTSYFTKYRKDDGVSIALKSPIGFDGPTYPDLFPKKSFLFKYKEDGNEESYTKAYHEQVLSRLDPQRVYEDLKDYTLLCWEGAGKFCHRRIVAEWLENELGVDIPEYEG